MQGIKAGENLSSIDESLSGDEHTVSIEDLLERLDTSESGLTQAEADRRMDEFGPNILEKGRKENQIIRFLKHFKNLFSVLLLIGSALSFIAEWLNPGQGNIYIAGALFGVVIINAIFTFFQEYKAEKIMENFQQLLPPHTRVIRDGNVKDELASDLVVGDIIVIEEGDLVPADARLVEVNSLKVDNSSLTGESEPQLRSLKCTHQNILECRNMVFSGTLVRTGNGKAVVIGTGNNTQIGSLATLTGETSTVDTPIKKEIKKFIEIISIIAISLGIIFFIAGYMIQEIFLASLIFAIGIIVANVPEGLLPTVTLSLTLASKRMAKRNALIKHLESVETLGSTTVICTDKTGTLTQNKMKVYSLYLNRKLMDAEQITDEGEAGDIFIRISGLCNNADLIDSDPGYSGDPTDGALLVFADDHTDLVDLHEHYPRLQEYPFDSLTKRMQAICSTPDGNKEAYVKGAPEVILDMCSQVHTEDGLDTLEDTDRKEILKKELEMAEKGERVIGLAYRPVEGTDEYVDDFIFLGLAGLQDPPRVEVKESIAKCHEAGIKVVMITGDHPVTAGAIAKSVGLNDSGEDIEFITGEELKQLSTEELAERLKSKSIVFARTSPLQKLKIVQAFQASGEVVTMTGDGVNDAPAIKHADMGVAMGNGTNVAQEAADMVLLDDNFATIVNAVEEGRTVFDNIKKFISYILTSNIPEILPFIAFILLGIPLPLTVLLILAIDLGTDIVPALALARERGEEDVMKKPPRSKDERLLTSQLLITSYGIKGPLEAAAGFACYFAVLYGGGWTWGDTLSSGDILYSQAITAYFAAIIICQIANVLTSRTRRQSSINRDLFKNSWIFYGIVLELIILAAIIWLPQANLVFNTAPVDLKYIVLAVPFALTIMFIDEIRKFLVRKDVSYVRGILDW